MRGGRRGLDTGDGGYWGADARPVLALAGATELGGVSLDSTSSVSMGSERLGWYR